ncbi:hypothetical protein GW17_00057072 [Ensete ventricosum]|nr:hypothetical protein GW17_00057072 [Ensete ventricosum]RZS14307.1 hypothetical protein BHM03_00045978 [Ensete ventricosum]
MVSEPRPPCKGAAGCGQAPCNGRLPVGAAVHKGWLPVDSPIASRGGGTGHRGGRPFAGLLPAAKGNRSLHKGSGGSDAGRVKEG